MFSNLTSTSVTLSWKLPPASHRNGIITHHIIRVRSHLFGTIISVVVPMPALLHTLVDLQPYSRYDVSVASATEVGPGIYTRNFSIITHPARKSNFNCKTYVIYVCFLLYASCSSIWSSSKYSSHCTKPNHS